MSRPFPDHHLVTRRLLLRPYTREDAVQRCTVQAPAARTGAGLARAVTRDGRLVGAIDLKRTDWAAGVTEIAGLERRWCARLTS